MLDRILGKTMCFSPDHSSLMMNSHQLVFFEEIGERPPLRIGQRCEHPKSQCCKEIFLHVEKEVRNLIHLGSSYVRERDTPTRVGWFSSKLHNFAVSDYRESHFDWYLCSRLGHRSPYHVHFQHHFCYKKICSLKESVPQASRFCKSYSLKFLPWVRQTSKNVLWSLRDWLSATTSSVTKEKRFVNSTRTWLIHILQQILLEPKNKSWPSLDIKIKWADIGRSNQEK